MFCGNPRSPRVGNAQVRLFTAQAGSTARYCRLDVPGWHWPCWSRSCCQRRQHNRVRQEEPPFETSSGRLWFRSLGEGPTRVVWAIRCFGSPLGHRPLAALLWALLRWVACFAAILVPIVGGGADGTRREGRSAQHRALGASRCPEQTLQHLGSLHANTTPRHALRRRIPPSHPHTECCSASAMSRVAPAIPSCLARVRDCGARRWQ